MHDEGVLTSSGWGLELHFECLHCKGGFGRLVVGGRMEDWVWEGGEGEGGHGDAVLFRVGEEDVPSRGVVAWEEGSVREWWLDRSRVSDWAVGCRAGFRGGLLCGELSLGWRAAENGVDVAFVRIKILELRRLHVGNGGRSGRDETRFDHELNQ